MPQSSTINENIRPDHCSVIVAPHLELTLAWTSSGLSRVTLTHKTRVSQPDPLQIPPFVTHALQLLRAYFTGIPTAFSDIPLDPPFASPFQTAVRRACRTIPWGHTRSYSWIASRIGRTNASRAVGNALARNPLPIIIPCHRVIRADGTLGGFTLGPRIKTHLLKLENVQLQA